MSVQHLNLIMTHCYTNPHLLTIFLSVKISSWCNFRENIHSLGPTFLKHNNSKNLICETVITEMGLLVILVIIKFENKIFHTRCTLQCFNYFWLLRYSIEIISNAAPPHIVHYKVATMPSTGRILSSSN